MSNILNENEKFYINTILKKIITTNILEKIEKIEKIEEIENKKIQLKNYKKILEIFNKNVYTDKGMKKIFDKIFPIISIYKELCNKILNELSQTPEIKGNNLKKQIQKIEISKINYGIIENIIIKYIYFEIYKNSINLNETSELIKNNYIQPPKKNGIQFSLRKLYFSKSIPILKKHPTSNSKDLLYMLNNLPKNNNDVRIVCHSVQMRALIEKYISRINTGDPSFLGFITTKLNNKQISSFNKAITKKDNLWKIFLMLNSKKISIVRHGNTFANILKEKSSSPYSYNQHSEKDTKLSIYGIFTSLLQCNILKNDEKNEIEFITNREENKKIFSMESEPKFIYVSILIRTWMTAICLYLPRLTSGNFTLIINPFLREKVSGNDDRPDNFSVQIENICKFLTFLIDLLKIEIVNFNKSIKNVKKLQISFNDDIQYSKTIKDNLKKIKSFFENEGNIYIILNEYKNENILITNHYKICLNGGKIINKNIYGVFGETNEYNKYQSESLSKKNKSLYYDYVIREGVKKPNPSQLKFYSRWCEPFSKKNISYVVHSPKKYTCEEKLDSRKNNNI